jgi:hypothetical protein
VSPDRLWLQSFPLGHSAAAWSVQPRGGPHREFDRVCNAPLAAQRASVGSTEATLRRLPRVSFERHFGALTQGPSAERVTPDWRWPVLVRMIWQRLVPRCPGIMSDRATSRAALRTRGAGTSAHQQARPGRLVEHAPQPSKSPTVGLEHALGPSQEVGQPSPRGTALWPEPCSTV